ncbi:hypothetical protein ILP92_03935 [Maribius pontilimi]|uniref:Uncharacterized protein n=1 Tax=Palleronia pontilimi TaxID=1964209 RepID=A0A934M8X7_9RHOB|nr:hypothetical protein [Palleronia pontilimi]MBJ3761897.1 hypothetical protein [Palleronia pontilimi]
MTGSQSSNYSSAPAEARIRNPALAGIASLARPGSFVDVAKFGQRPIQPVFGP